MFRKFILVCFVVILSNISFGQNGSISGFVYDASNGEALIGANVYLKEINMGASTNLSGYFVIPNIPSGKYSLVVSYIGYRTTSREVKVNGKTEILKINLETDVLQTKTIVVTGDSARTIDKLFIKPVSRIELNASQINSIPKVIEADLLRSLQTLPGIQPLSDFSSALYVRGGTPDQNLYMIDGTDVYNPEHAFGLFSTFNTSAIKKVELSKGGFSAEYGGRLSSILNVTNLDGNRNKFQSDVTISLLSASTTIQMPIGSIGSLSGSIRRTYLDQTYAKFIDEVPDYYFYDGNVKAFFDLDDENKLVLSFYGGRDVLDFKFDKDKENSTGFDYDWGNKTGSINWKRIFSPKLFGSFWVTASRFSSYFSFKEFELREENSITDLTFKGNLEYYFSKQLNLKFGFEEKNIHGVFFEDFPGGKVDAGKHRNQYTGYLTSSWRPGDLWDIEAGVRYDYFNSDKDYQNLDPRLSLKYRLTETSNLKFSTGIFHQYLNRIPRLFLTSIWTSADKYAKGSKANHYILSFQKEISNIYEFEMEVYYKEYKDIYSFNQTFLSELTADDYDQNNEPVYKETEHLFRRGDGNSLGLELLLKKDYGAVNGWIGYSLARTENTVDGLNQGRSFVPRHDRTQTVNVVTNVNINDLLAELSGTEDNGSSNWLFSMNFIYSTGQPLTLPGSVYAAAAFPNWDLDKTNIALYPAELNSVRLPAYSRMDISLTYEKKYKWGTFAPYLQIFNVGNRKNVWFINYENEIKENRVDQKIETVNMLPILPSIGVNIKF